MTTLSEVTTLISERAADLEKAKEVFTAETRAFVSGILGAVRRARSEPWAQGRIRIDLPREVEMDGKSSVSLESPYARCQLRFRKETTYRHVGDIRFGLEFEEAAGSFVWQIVLVPNSRYSRMDDLVWAQVKTSGENATMPGAVHQTKANTVRFVQRPVNQELSGECAFTDLKQVFEILLGADRALAEAVGIEQDEQP
jgi:hypothetical protein